MLTVHHLNHSRSQRILWLLEELGLDYEIKRYQRLPSGLAPRQLKEVHPLGKSPVITDGDLVLAESGAMAEYLLETYDTEYRLHPAPGDPLRQRHRYWLHYAEGSLMPWLLLKLVFGRLKGPPVPWALRPITRKIASQVNATLIGPNLKTHGAFLEDALADTGHFVGDALTGADILMSFPVQALVERGGAALPHLSAFVQQIQARPAYQRALERGGPFEIMG
jgi:glutathione S-transferase